MSDELILVSTIAFLCVAVVGLFVYVSYLHGRIERQSEFIGHILNALRRLENQINHI